MTTHWFDTAKFWAMLKSIDWSDRDFDHRKMCIMSLFSELVYHKITSADIAQTERASIVPCRAFQELVVAGSGDIDQLTRQLDVQILEVLSFEHFVVVIFRVHTITIVAFRGTAKLYDWLINLNARTMAFEGGRVHRGFFKETFKEISDLSNSTHLNADTIYITGHSLGGALAALMSLITSPAIDTKIKSVYTFGTPRYGDNKASYNWIKPYSCIRAGDPVPNLPPDSKLFHYTDPDDLRDPAGQPVRFDRSFSIKDYIQFYFRLRFCKFAPDHLMERYIQDIVDKI
jgi:hypothetical protein